MDGGPPPSQRRLLCLKTVVGIPPCLMPEANAFALPAEPVALYSKTVQGREPGKIFPFRLSFLVLLFCRRNRCAP